MSGHHPPNRPVQKMSGHHPPNRPVQKMSPEKNPGVYHERQRLQFCLLHSLNNLFQRKDAFTRRSLDLIAERLVLGEPDGVKWTPLSLLFKPHHNALTGNYDVNVLIAALEGEGKRVAWHDHRSGADAIGLEGPGGGLMGLVLNVPVRRYAGLWRSRHWVAVREVEGVWYNLDSDLDVPRAFRNVEEVREFLDLVMANGGEVLLVLNDDPLSEGSPVGSCCKELIHTEVES